MTEKRKITEELDRQFKAKITDSDLPILIQQLEKESQELYYQKIMKSGSDNPQDKAEVKRLEEKKRKVDARISKLNTELDKKLKNAKATHPDYLRARVLEKQRSDLEKDLKYLDKGYFEDKKRVESGKGGAKTFEARKRKAEFEAKYKSAEVDIDVKGIHIEGGEYVRKIILEQLKNFGLKNPELKGIENIDIGALQSSFTTSGSGVSSKGDKPGVAIQNIFLKKIEATQLLIEQEGLKLDTGALVFHDVDVSLNLDFIKNPLEKNPFAELDYKIEQLKVKKAEFNGIKLFMGKKSPLLDFPKGETSTVEVLGLHVWDYDPDVKNINLRIQDVIAAGTYQDKDEEKKNKPNHWLWN